jgi:hypothetical protein
VDITSVAGELLFPGGLGAEKIAAFLQRYLAMMGGIRRPVLGTWNLVLITHHPKLITSVV